MVDLTYINDAHAITGDGCLYIEALCEERADISSISTNYAIGSKVICTNDWSLWMLSRDNGSKKWVETSGITVSVTIH